MTYAKTVPKPCLTRQTGRTSHLSVPSRALLAVLDFRRLPALPTISFCGLRLVAAARGLVATPLDEDIRATRGDCGPWPMEYSTAYSSPITSMYFSLLVEGIANTRRAAGHENGTSLKSVSALISGFGLSGATTSSGREESVKECAVIDSFRG